MLQNNNRYRFEKEKKKIVLYNKSIYTVNSCVSYKYRYSPIPRGRDTFYDFQTNVLRMRLNFSPKRRSEKNAPPKKATLFGLVSNIFNNRKSTSKNNQKSIIITWKRKNKRNSTPRSLTRSIIPPKFVRDRYTHTCAVRLNDAFRSALIRLYSQFISTECAGFWEMKTRHAVRVFERINSYRNYE